MAEQIIIAVDAMGGDNAPDEIVKGAVEAVTKQPDIHVILLGDRERVENVLKSCTYPEGSISVRHTTQVIETSEHPVEAIRRKKDSSIVVGMNLVKNKEAQAFISAGNSGAVLVGGQVIVGRIRGVERPPFASVIPTEKGISLLLDCGANVDARPSHMVQFAQMGSIYMEHVIGVSNPSVGLVNIGVEEEKGNALVRDTFPLLKACEGLHFIGSVEARDIPAGGTDVLVCDAFVGNVILKMYEGTAGTMLKVLKEALTSTLTAKIGALLVKSPLKKAMKRFDAHQYGGAPMLGLNGLVMKTHGSAKAQEVSTTILQSREFILKDISGRIREYLEKTDLQA